MASSEYLTWQKVKALDYTFPDGFDEQAKDLVQKLLVKSPTERLGAGSGKPHDMKALKAHPFFALFDWTTALDYSCSDPRVRVGEERAKARKQPLGDGSYGWDHVVSFPRSHDEIPWAGRKMMNWIRGQNTVAAPAPQ